MKIIIFIMAGLTAISCDPIITSLPTVVCSSQNCNIHFANMAEENFDEMITSEQSGILALKFSSCQLDRIPENTFEKLPMLLCLMITTPGLTSLVEDSFLNASNLQFLYLPGNRITKLGPNAFRGATNLNEINLTDNEIEVMSENAFVGLEHLESLSLTGNQIVFFGQETFTPLTELKNLDISGNMIEFLDVRLFLNNKKLRGINIANNELLSISNGFVQMLPQIKILNLMNNPCTKGTMLENIPLIKLIDNEVQGSGDESSLDRCYNNYIKMTDPESGDMDDLLSQAEVVVDDIETNLISELTDKLRKRDVEIKRLKALRNLYFYIYNIPIIMSLFYIMKKGYQTYRLDLMKRIEEFEKDKQRKIATVDTKQSVYTIKV